MLTSLSTNDDQRNLCVSSQRDKEQYNNLNLNHGHQSSLNSNEISIQINNIKDSSVTNKKLENAEVNHGHQQKQNIQFEDRSMEKRSQMINCIVEERNDNKESSKMNKQNSTVSSSTLSLHIAAYENSIVNTGTNDNTDNGKEKAAKNQKNVLEKAVKNVRQLFNGTNMELKNAFEIPRQRNEKQDVPEVMQFKTSQRLADLTGSLHPIIRRGSSKEKGRQAHYNQIMVSREVRERTIKNLSVLKLKNEDIYKRALTLVNQSENVVKDALLGQDTTDKKAAIYLVVSLTAASAEITTGDESGMTKSFAEGLLECMKHSSESSMRLASRAIFYLIQTSKSYAVEIADMTMNACGEWLDDSQKPTEQQRLSTLIILRDFALFTRPYFLRKASYYFQHIFKFIREHKNHRHIACQSLHAALTVISQREHRQKNEWYKKCLDEAEKRIEGGSKEDALLSSLLIYNEILRIGSAKSEYIRLGTNQEEHNNLAKTKSISNTNPVLWVMEETSPPIVESHTAQAMILERFKEILKAVSEARNYRSSKIMDILLELYPRIVSINVQYLPIRELFAVLLQGSSKNTQMLQCIGLICRHDPSNTRFMTKETMDQITKHIIAIRPKNGLKTVDEPVFKALSNVIIAHGEEVTPKVKSVLSQLFNIGLVESVIEVLHNIVKYLPQLVTESHDGLLELLWRTLMHQPRPSKFAPPTPPPAPQNSVLVIKSEDVPTIRLALHALGSFDFQRHALQMFINYIAQGYLRCDQIDIRLAAIECCAKIVKPFVRIYDKTELPQKIDVYRLIRNVLEGLINLAVVDREVEVRLAVLKAFVSKDRDFLYHLAQRDMLDNLFMTLYDENPQIQEAAVGLLGVLAELNPAYVYPKLRRVILESIGQLSNSKITNLEEQSAKCIAVLAETSPKFVMPYMDSILSALEPHLSHEKRSVGVTFHVLNALSHLSHLGGMDIVKHLQLLFKPLLQYLQDSTSLSRRETSLKAMSGLCQSTAYVVDPYREHPELLDVLLKLLKTELNMNMRRLIIKTLGIVGALDPYTYKVFLGTVSSTRTRSTAVSLPSTPESDDPRHDIIRWINYEKCTLEQFYPAITIATLIQMIHDEALTPLHKQILNALCKIFEDIPKDNLKQYVHQVLPKLITLTESANQEFRQFYVFQFKQLAPLFQLNMKPYLKDIFKIIASTWSDYPEMSGLVIDLLAEIGRALGTEFSPFVSDLCPYLLAVVQMDTSKEKRLTEKALHCVSAINPCLDPHLHLIVPPVIYVIDDVENTVTESIRIVAIKTLDNILHYHSIGERAPMVMQMWLRNIYIKNFHEPLMKILNLIVEQMWGQFVIYCDTVCAQLVKYKVAESLIIKYYEILKTVNPTKAAAVLQILPQGTTTNITEYQKPITGESVMAYSPTGAKRIPLGSNSNERPSKPKNYQTVTEAMQNNRRQLMLPATTKTETKKAPNKILSFEHLDHIWKPPISSTIREDWLLWMDIMRLECLKNSPANALNCCSQLAESHPPLAKELFHATFMSIWTHLTQHQQDNVALNFKEALEKCPYIEPIQAILNLSEFMDHCSAGPLPVNYPLLSKSASQVQAYAKALRYKELELWERASDYLDSDLSQMHAVADDCQQIITYAKKLNLEELALGVITYAKRLKMDVSGKWHEKLGQWETALQNYETEMSTLENLSETDMLDYKLRQMRCLEQLFEWRRLNEVASEHLSKKSKIEDYSGDREATERKQKILQIAARGAWTVQDWKKMSEITAKLNENTVEGAFLRAVVAVKEDNYPQAINYINKVRDTFDSELTAMAAESYERAYSAIVMAQHLTELEEAIEYKLVPERRTRIAVVWSRRLQGISLDVDQWHKALIVRQLVMSKNELRPMWIKFAGLCRKKGKPEIAARTLRNLIDAPEGAELHNIQLPFDRPQLTLAIIKQIWNENHRSNAIEKLEILTSQLMKALQSTAIPPDQLQPIARVTAKCYLLLGDWQSSYGTHGHGIHSANASPSPSRHASVSSRIHTPTGSSHHGYYRNQKSGGHTSAVLSYYLTATNLQHHWQKAWKRLAILYYDLVMDKSRSDDGSSHLINPLLSDYSTFESQFEQSQGSSSNTRTPHVQDSNEDTSAPRNFTVPSNSEHSIQEWTDPNIPMYQDIQHQQFQKSRANEPPSPSQSIILDSESIGEYARRAVNCYFKAIQFSEGSSLEDTLRLFMLWVEHGNRKIVEECIKNGIKIISPETWLEIAPQLITRLDLDDDVGKLIKELVTNVAKTHPHGLIYPLIAAQESKNATRAAAAKEILDTLSETNQLLVEQGQMLNHELIRCAILWHEQWHETLEEASKIFFHPDGPKDINQMLALLRPLHERLNGGHQTLKEFSFIQTYYKELKEAFDYCEKYRRTNDHNDINGAWDIYYNVFRRISHQLRQLTSLDLNYVAPALATAKNLILCVPGTYDPNGRLITIQSIDPILPVILSKQRPRKLTMRGDDGNEYVFLLKGHEDPRQDERVMQLFGLINTLILKDPDTCRRDLTIQRYAIIALSQTSGLIGWVPNCDTLHALIKDYREKRNISISEENDKMQELCPGYHSSFERLTLMQKVEIFREALRKTKGNDLRDTLWMKSPTSEVWFDRRTNFTRSMACSSMVGYILGLGDRHPSNVMLDRLSGKIVHIDFGDCFEVAMRREKYPERVPFRLTRMLIHAMEVTGIEGNYRITCERILRLIRQNRFSILAVLEAFVYDPVVNWFKIPETGREAETNRRRNQSMYEVMDSHVRARSKEAIDRVKDKLNGYDFIPPHHNPARDGIIKEMDVRIHVERLIEQATLAENLCQGYIGWCPFW